MVRFSCDSSSSRTVSALSTSQSISQTKAQSKSNASAMAKQAAAAKLRMSLPKDAKWRNYMNAVLGHMSAERVARWHALVMGTNNKGDTALAVLEFAAFAAKLRRKQYSDEKAKGGEDIHSAESLRVLRDRRVKMMNMLLPIAMKAAADSQVQVPSWDSEGEDAKPMISFSSDSTALVETSVEN